MMKQQPIFRRQLPLLTDMTVQRASGAIIEGPYRYLLWRTWKPEAGQVVFVMLNPSRADDVADDPTIRRCLSFARAWGFGSLAVMYLFGYRTSSPRHPLTVTDPVGPANDAYLLQGAAQAARIIVAWGCFGGYHGRDRTVIHLLRGYSLFCLGLTKDQHPRHPLFVPGDTSCLPYRGEA